MASVQYYLFGSFSRLLQELANSEEALYVNCFTLAIVTFSSTEKFIANAILSFPGGRPWKSIANGQAASSLRMPRMELCISLFAGEFFSQVVLSG